MINIALLRNNKEETKNKILKKEPTFDVEKLFSLDQEKNRLTAEIENIRKERNEISQKAGFEGLTDQLRERSVDLAKKLKEKDKTLASISDDFKNLALSCPNIPEEEVPEGNKESNKVITTVGEKPTFSFEIKNHIELNNKNCWFDFPAASKMSGANFVLHKAAGAKVVYALTRLMIKNNVKYGFEPVIPPYLVSEQALINSGNLPKFKGDFYEMPDDKLCLIPTAEVCLTNIHANEILEAGDLPKRYTSWTSCFRREAGGYGSEERGLIRIHQFEKVEIYSICKPSDSNAELDKMLACSQDLLKQLGLHYQVSLLAAQDCSFSSAKTYDIEVWLPGQNRFYEVSSCSNCTDFQARRAKIRFRPEPNGTSTRCGTPTRCGKPELVHTLNSSSLALPRLMVALMEQYQQEDGSIKLPEMLEKEVAQTW